METLQAILETVIPIAIALIVAAVARYLIPWLKAEVGEAQFNQVLEIAKTAVTAVEQLGLKGEEAKAYAIDFAQKLLDSKGIEIDVAVLANLIEATLYQEINQYKSQGFLEIPEPDQTMRDLYRAQAEIDLLKETSQQLQDYINSTEELVALGKRISGGK